MIEMTPTALFPQLVCPFEHSPLVAEPAGDALACKGHHRFPVRAGIARLVAAEQNYAEAFGA